MEEGEGATSSPAPESSDRSLARSVFKLRCVYDFVLQWILHPVLHFLFWQIGRFCAQF